MRLFLLCRLSLTNLFIRSKKRLHTLLVFVASFVSILNSMLNPIIQFTASETKGRFVRRSLKYRLEKETMITEVEDIKMRVSLSLSTEAPISEEV